MKGSFTDAKNCFENAIAINPNHVPSIQHLVSTLSPSIRDRVTVVEGPTSFAQNESKKNYCG